MLCSTGRFQQIHLIKLSYNIEESAMTISAVSYRIALIGLLALPLSACAPEIGSERWCNNLKEKPKGDWSANEAGNFAKHCIFK